MCIKCSTRWHIDSLCCQENTSYYLQQVGATLVLSNSICVKKYITWQLTFRFTVASVEVDGQHAVHTSHSTRKVWCRLALPLSRSPVKVFCYPPENIITPACFYLSCYIPEPLIWSHLIIGCHFWSLFLLDAIQSWLAVPKSVLMIWLLSISMVWLALNPSVFFIF